MVYHRGAVLPNFLVIGAQRAGTSLLHQILSSHPEIYVPHQRKEIHYFDRYYDRGLSWYSSYFPSREAAATYGAIGEATPDYLAWPEAAPRIAATLPGSRLVAILRNPVDRAYSWYQYCRRNNNERRDIKTFMRQDLSALNWGLYSKHLACYKEYCSRQPFLVILYEDLLSEPRAELGRLAEFLSLEQPFTQTSQALGRKVNASEIPKFRVGFAMARRVGGFLLRHDVNWPVRAAKRFGVRALFGRAAATPPLPPDVRSWLEQYYAEDVARLSALLHRDDLWWSQK